MSTEEERAAHDYVPPELAAVLPRLGATSGKANPTVHLKLFVPWSSWTWFVTEYDPADRLLYGLVDGMEEELGYTSLEEIEALRGPGGLRVERDLHWRPRPLTECYRAARGMSK